MSETHGDINKIAMEIQSFFVDGEIAEALSVSSMHIKPFVTFEE
jgi:hypothetical protein